MKSRLQKLFKNHLVHPLRTTIAAIIALLLARQLALPEVYWAPISAIVVMESTLGATFAVSWRRLAGTVIGSVVGALLLSFFGPNLLGYAFGIFIIGILCSLLWLEIAAYRFAGVAFTVIMFIAHDKPAWIIALHRCIEISVGIIVSLILTAIWQQKPSGKSAKKKCRSKS